MHVYESIILSMLDIIIILILLHNIMNYFSTSIIHKVIYIISGSVLITFIGTIVHKNIFSYIISLIIGYMIFIIYLYKNQKKELLSNTITFFVITLIIIIIKLLVIIVFNWLIDELKYSFLNSLILKILGLIISLLITKVLPLCNIYLLIKKKNIFSIIVITIMFILSYCISILWYINTSYIIDKIIYIIIIFLIILIKIVLVKNELLIQAYKGKLKIYETYLPVIDNVIDELKKKQHDYHNHLQTLSVLNEDNNIKNSEILSQYISNYKKDNIWNELLKINNKIIIGLFYSKYIYAKQHGINILFNINNFNYYSKYTDYELVELYGILIDNAIEATNSQDMKKDIEITLEKSEKNNLFRIINPFYYISSKQINKFFKKDYSTKEGNNRGIGLYKLKKLLESKEDTIYFSYDTLTKSVIVEIEHS